MGKVRPTYGILFGFCKDDEDQVGYFAMENGHSFVSTEEELAMHFPLRKKRGQVGFGTPQQWCDLVNSDEDLCHGYKFHVVKKV